MPKDTAGRSQRVAAVLKQTADFRIPLYTICKTLVFLYLALGSRGTPYVYNTILAPLFAEHEPAIDEFIAGIRGQAGSQARGTFGWLYDFIRRQLGVSIAICALVSRTDYS